MALFLCHSAFGRVYKLKTGNHLVTILATSLQQCNISTSSSCFAGYKVQNNLKECYNLLNVQERCTAEELKEAYFKRAKEYHPDSKTSTADAKKFDQVQKAYVAIKQHMETVSEKEKLGTTFTATSPAAVNEDDDDDELGFKPQKAQHRQYLDNEGFGVGSRADRHRQYEQLKVSRAQQNVFKYRAKKMMTAEDKETAVAEKDKQKAKRNKISNSMDRLVEDMISEAMSKGDFTNLPGSGKPIDFSKESPYVDKLTQKMNQVLLDNDFTPDWVMMGKEIRESLQQCRENLATELKLLGAPPYTDKSEQAFVTHSKNFQKAIEDINDKVQKFNFCVPMLHRQMMPYTYQRELKKVSDNIDEYLPEDYDKRKAARKAVKQEQERILVLAQESGEKMTLLQSMWDGFVNVFQLRRKT